MFADASSKDVWKTRVAKSASSGGNAHTAFVRLNTLKQINADSWVATSRLANGAVTTAKIADAAVTTGKIADGNVSTAKIADSAITGAKVANGAIGKTKVDVSVAISPGDIGGTDADEITQPGLYRVASNGPAGASAQVFVTGGPAIGGMGAIAFQLTGGGVGDIYVRSYASGSWGSWTLINDASA